MKAVLFAVALLLFVPVESSSYTVSAVENGGSISGVVKFKSDYPEPEFTRVDRDNETCGVRQETEEFVVDAESKGLRHVVASVDGIESGKAFPETKLTIDQQGCRYEPHVQIGFAAAVDDADAEEDGPRLVILNSDDVFHNVHAYSGTDADETVFNTPSIPEQVIQKQLDGPGVYQVKCDIHAWMSAWIALFEHPYAVVTDAQGGFTIEDVPPGTYTLRLWHEGLGDVEREVVVKAGENSFVDFTIGE